MLLEKAQVAALADRITDILDTLLRRSGGALPIPAVAPRDHVDLDPLDSPVEEEFRVGTLSLAWDDENESVVVEAYAAALSELEIEGLGDEGDEPTEGDEDSDDDQVAELQSALLARSDVLRVVLSGVAARGFAERAQRVVAAGRPPCPFCNLPLDPDGHLCPRQNGYRRRS